MLTESIFRNNKFISKNIDVYVNLEKELSLDKKEKQNIVNKIINTDNKIKKELQFKKISTFDILDLTQNKKDILKDLEEIKKLEIKIDTIKSNSAKNSLKKELENKNNEIIIKLSKK
jgi:hypothetical protein